MKEGKRGYWEGKKRDPYTLKRLSESKYKKVIQYDKDGNFIKQWNSLKEIATKLIGDYKVVNGSAESKIYHLLSKKKPKYIRTRLFKNNYWFKEHELIEYFGIIPKKINIKNILDNEEKIRHIIRKENYKKSKKTKLYTVIQYDNYGNVINNFKNVFHAGYVLKKSPETISRISRSDIKSTLNLKYGPKKSYPINERYNYPDYKITPTPRIYKNNKKRYKTRTRSTIEVIKNNQSLGVFDDINLVVKEIKINANKIYRYMRLNKPTKEGYLFINRGKKQIKLDSLKNTLLNFKQTL